MQSHATQAMRRKMMWLTISLPILAVGPILGLSIVGKAVDELGDDRPGMAVATSSIQRVATPVGGALRPVGATVAAGQVRVDRVPLNISQLAPAAFGDWDGGQR